MSQLGDFLKKAIEEEMEVNKIKNKEYEML